MKLETIFQAQLDHAFGLSESEIAGRRDLAGQRVVAGRDHRIVELRMIERIEQFRPELEAMSCRDVARISK